jgi:hypothetical protein
VSAYSPQAVVAPTRRHSPPELDYFQAFDFAAKPSLLACTMQKR